ncbi:MAG: hypothetical protein NWE78_02205 [Candidatus Bathyarchaeota archaeon]|nr:hypothetical protein [Candidatus Bathyarchaeota archaeon]
MTCEKKVTRGIVIQKLVDVLQPLDYVIAFWEGGAPGFSRTDEWSDIDIYVVVDDEKVAQTFQAVELALKSLSPIQQKYEVKQSGWPGVSQAFYRLKNASEYLIIDLAVLTLSSPEKFLEPKTHGRAIFYFNKDNRVALPSLDGDALLEKLYDRLDRLRGRFYMFHNFVQKEINRGNYLEAVDIYHTLLATLVEALRIKYNPVHHEFRMRYIHYELPDEIIMRLKHIYFVADQKDLQDKYRETVAWFCDVISQVKSEELERLVRGSQDLESETNHKL